MATKISGGVFIDLLQNGDSLNTTLNATKSLYQNFKKGTESYNPNWKTEVEKRPIIYPRSYSTMEQRELTLRDIAWEYNDVAMTFDTAGLCTAPDIAVGKIKQIEHNGVKALNIIDNIASDSNNDSDTISFTGKVTASGGETSVKAQITLMIEEGSANLYRMFLNMDDDVLDGNETSLSMVADLLNSGVSVTTGVEFEFINVANNQVLRAKGTSPTFTINKNVIDSELMVLCKAYIAGKVVAQEQRQVWDATDPYVILCDQGVNVRQSNNEDRVYNFSVYNAGLGMVMSGVIFVFKVIKTTDTSDVTSQFTKTNTSVTIAGAKLLTIRPLYISASCEI